MKIWNGILFSFEPYESAWTSRSSYEQPWFTEYCFLHRNKRLKSETASTMSYWSSNIHRLVTISLWLYIFENTFCHISLFCFSESLSCIKCMRCKLLLLMITVSVSQSVTRLNSVAHAVCVVQLLPNFFGLLFTVSLTVDIGEYYMLPFWMFEMLNSLCS